MSPQLVQHAIGKVDGRGQSQPVQQTTHGPGEAKLGQQQNPAALIATNQRPVRKDEPPTLGALLLGHRSEQRLGLFIGEGQQPQLATPIDDGDDTRRPTTEFSSAGKEQHRSLDLYGRNRCIHWVASNNRPKSYAKNRARKMFPRALLDAQKPPATGQQLAGTG
jgi:hypothetical protein